MDSLKNAFTSIQISNITCLSRSVRTCVRNLEVVSSMHCTLQVGCVRGVHSSGGPQAALRRFLLFLPVFLFLMNSVSKGLHLPHFATCLPDSQPHLYAVACTFSDCNACSMVEIMSFSNRRIISRTSDLYVGSLKLRPLYFLPPRKQTPVSIP